MVGRADGEDGERCEGGVVGDNPSFWVGADGHEGLVRARSELINFVRSDRTGELLCIRVNIYICTVVINICLASDRRAAPRDATGTRKRSFPK